MNLYKFHTNPEQLKGYENKFSIPRVAYEHAKDVIGGRFPEAEAAIAKDPDSAVDYARDVIEGRWINSDVPPEIAIPAEDAIAKNPEMAYRYVMFVIHSRWPKVEPIIAKDPRLATQYAAVAIRNRWTESEVPPEIARQAEESIATDPTYSAWYENYFKIKL